MTKASVAYSNSKSNTKGSDVNTILAMISTYIKKSSSSESYWTVSKIATKFLELFLREHLEERNPILENLLHHLKKANSRRFCTCDFVPNVLRCIKEVGLKNVVGSDLILTVTYVGLIPANLDVKIHYFNIKEVDKLNQAIIKMLHSLEHKNPNVSWLDRFEQIIQTSIKPA